MLKKTLFFSNPYYLAARLNQLVITDKETGEIRKTPIEDLGFVILDHPQITFTQAVMQALAEQNVAVVFCDKQHLPASMLFHLDTHQVQNEKFRAQVSAGEPLKKQLWQQTIKAKIINQGAVLQQVYDDPGVAAPLLQMARDVKSGDTTQRESKAARFYWPRLFGENFKRDRYGMPPNPGLNYGYAILRAAVARAITGSGLLPTLGIHHRNKYNAYCLADDIMEPYRAFVDQCVWEMKETIPDYHNMTPEIKARLLQILSCDVQIDKLKRPLMVALSLTTASLAGCFEGRVRKIRYPVFCATKNTFHPHGS